MLIAAAVVIGGCRDGYTGPGAPEDPSYIALLLPAVQQVREAARRVKTSSGADWIFGIQERLFANGAAVGVATLTDPDNPSRRVHYRFESGEAACENNSPAVRVTGLSVYQCPSDCVPATARARLILRPASAEAANQAHADVGIDASRGEEPTLTWEWDADDPAGRAGEHFVTPVKELYFSPQICASR